QPQDRRQQRLEEAEGDALVEPQKAAEIVALLLEDAVVPLVLVAVPALLAEEGLHPRAQLGVLDALEVVLDAADEEALALREEEIEPVGDVREDGISVQPPARNLRVGEGEVHLAHADRARGLRCHRAPPFARARPIMKRSHGRANAPPRAMSLARRVGPSGARARSRSARPWVSGSRPGVSGSRPGVSGARARVSGARARVSGARARDDGARPWVSGARPRF